MVNRTPQKAKTLPLPKFNKGDCVTLIRDVVLQGGSTIPEGASATVIDAERVGATYYYSIVAENVSAWVMQTEIK